MNAKVTPIKENLVTDFLEPYNINNNCIRFNMGQNIKGP